MVLRCLSSFSCCTSMCLHSLTGRQAAFVCMMPSVKLECLCLPRKLAGCAVCVPQWPADSAVLIHVAVMAWSLRLLFEVTLTTWMLR